jgi:hypothetical protein
MAWSHTPASPALCSASKAGEPARAGLETLQEDGPLSGGTANRGLVICVGDTVQRPTASCWPATHALLAHLSAVGVDGAPGCWQLTRPPTQAAWRRRVASDPHGSDCLCPLLG